MCIRDSGTDDDYNSIQGQLYDVDGDPVGGEFQVNTYTTGRQEDVAVAADGLGNFIVAWESDLTEMKGQLYDVSGAAVGGEFQINTTGYGNRPDVAANSAGDFVIAWEGGDAPGTDTERTSIQVQQYDSGGNPVGNQFQVNTYTTDWQRDPSVAMDSAGNFIIAWESDGSFGTDNSEESIQAQYFVSGGSPEGGEFQINTLTTNEQANPAVTTGPSGGIFVVWNSYKNSAGNDSSYRSVQGQRYSAGAEVIFSDGFESGDTSTWSGTTQ